MHVARPVALSVVCLAVCFARLAAAQEYQPAIAPASDQAERAIAGFRVPDYLKASVWAAEPMLANPVAFKLDARGRAYVCETFRQQKGVEDNRYHMAWLEDDLAAQTVEDRLAYFKKHLGEKVQDYALEHDRIRLVEDRDGDGKADLATVYADGFNQIVDGTGAGVLPYQGDVYYTCIPHLWRLRDTNADGQADERESLSDGYGVRVAFRGHDSHGLIMGPDGRLYFSIGDRGYNLATREGKKLVRPYCGAVFRCEPDGSILEVFAYGLRNPQELAFDNYGNLFTGENNSDSGDQARWVYVMQDGDAGWRMYYQYLEDRGPWNREKLWHPPHEGQAAYIVPPVANIADGPSGLVHYPGVGLPQRYREHFFLCDFRGTPSKSGVRSFAVKPKGAGFELTDSHEFIWQILCTDIDFDYQGRVYLSDWVNGWDGLGKGRIYRFAKPSKYGDDAAVAFLQDGYDKLKTDRLLKFLTHTDQRIRQAAQFALVRKSAARELEDVAKQSDNRFARFHAIWGLGQLGRVEPDRLAGLVTLLEDEDTEVQVQVARVLADAAPLPSAKARLLALLKDDSLRVQSFAARAVGRFGDPATVTPLLDALAADETADPYLRHAVVMALSEIGGDHLWSKWAIGKEQPDAVRLALALALRRLQDERVALFLSDTHPLVVLAAARAIHDEPIDDALGQLAQLYASDLLRDENEQTDALARRVANACFRSGRGDLLVRMGTRADLPATFRRYALEAVLDWRDPSPLDRVLNDYRPLPKNRSTKEFAGSLAAALPSLLSDERLQLLSIQLTGEFQVRDLAPKLAAVAASPQATEEHQVQSLRALARLKTDNLQAQLLSAANNENGRVRLTARRLLTENYPEAAVDSLVTGLTAELPAERQGAVKALSQINAPRANEVLLEWVQRLGEGKAPGELQLELIEVAASRDDVRFRNALAKFEASRDANDTLADYRECLTGGDAARGESIVWGRSDASCRRCHKVNDNGGEVGPDLTTIGKEKTREYLLESIVHPNAQIAKDFETTTIYTDRGRVFIGIVKAENDAEVTLMKADGEIISVAKETIDERTTGQSAMPELAKFLSKRDLRDIVEYLASLKKPAEEEGHP